MSSSSSWRTRPRQRHSADRATLPATHRTGRGRGRGRGYGRDRDFGGAGPAPPPSSRHSMPPMPSASAPSCSRSPSPPPLLPPRPRPRPRTMERPRPHLLPYLLMHDKLGWSTLSGSGLGLDTDYLQLHHAHLPEVDVPKGTLVELDPLCDYDPRTNVSLNVVSLDAPHTKAALLMKELFPLEEEIYERLLPLKPFQRYQVVTHPDRHGVLCANVGDLVWCVDLANGDDDDDNNGNGSDMGLIQYVGPLKGKGPGNWYGIELLDSRRGNSNGTFGERRYFSAPPCSSLFVSAASLFIYKGENDPGPLRATSNTNDSHVYVNNGAIGRQGREPRVEAELKDQEFKRGEFPSNFYEEEGKGLVLVRSDPERYLPNGREVASKISQNTHQRDHRPEEVVSAVDTDHRPRLAQQDEVDDAEVVDRGPQVAIGDRIVWISDQGPEYGWVRWMGHVASENEEFLAGIEFDNPVGNGNGSYRSHQLFKTKPRHASLVPLDGLLRAEDFDGSSLQGQYQGQGQGHRPLSYSQAASAPLASARASASASSSSASPSADDDDNDDVDDDDLLPLHSGQDVRAALHRSPPPLLTTRNNVMTENEPVNDLVMCPAENELVDLLNGGRSSLSTSPVYEAKHLNQSSTSRRDQRNRDLRISQNQLNLGDFMKTNDRAGRVRGRRAQRQQQKHRQDASPSPPSSPPRPPARPVFDRLEEGRSALNTCPDVEPGRLVKLSRAQEDLFGVVRWVGWLADWEEKGAGIELEEELLGATNGWYNGSQLFSCADRKAVFVPFTHFALDERFGGGDKRAAGAGADSNGIEPGSEARLCHFGDMDCPAVPGFHAPVKVSDVNRVCGRNKGVQGHQNSCYLDATLFAMFAFTSVFDSLLYRPPTPQDIAEFSEVQRVLREEIVNPLRKNMFVRADRVMKLRKFLDHLTSVRGLMSEEKDPEEFLNSLLTQTLRAAPFLDLSSGQSSHLYQLFVERRERSTMPSVQELFEQSFRTSDIKLKRVPAVMILQMPRFGRQFKVYDRIMPSQLLDVTDIIEEAPRQCIICGKLASLECLDCFGDHGSGLDSTAFCQACLSPVHNHQKRANHRARQIRVPSEYLAHGSRNVCPRLFMELFAVVSIETSHYVSFVKCGLGPDAPWCFFDSMADRKGEMDGYNIPEVSSAAEVTRWFSDEGVAFLESCKDDKSLPVQAKRFICDGYMCFYQSPEVMMYQ